MDFILSHGRTHGRVGNRAATEEHFKIINGTILKQKSLKRAFETFVKETYLKNYVRKYWCEQNIKLFACASCNIPRVRAVFVNITF